MGKRHKRLIQLEKIARTTINVRSSVNGDLIGPMTLEHLYFCAHFGGGINETIITPGFNIIIEVST